ncbi:MAG: carbohydrate-binding domain-containing protein [Parabacteroides sp.]|nr:carbohydrate-binding domain-containing protein [Parabacteroides sp.]
MNKSKRLAQLLLILLMVGNFACLPSVEDPFFDEMPGDFPGGMFGGNGSVSDDGDTPEFDSSITEWNGEKADDAHIDVVGTDEDYYFEANSFTDIVTITYNGANASVECSNRKILYHVQGAYVTVDMQTNAVSNVEIAVKGKSDDGGLKIYGEKKYKLSLCGIELTSQRGPAINSQCKKRIFVHLQEGTMNRLTDIATYSEDTYYLDSSVSEDRKGCFFSEGNLIFSGTGVLSVAGKYKHGIVTDGYFWMRPGVTLVVTEATKNGIHVKGDSDDQIGVYIKGGLIYTHISATAGKGIKTDQNVEITGGRLLLNTSGNAVFDSDENDTSSAAAIKTDGSIFISGGTHTFKSTGTGGKGLNSDVDIVISGGETTITTTGGKYAYSSDLTSSPKGAKADGNVTISGGKLNISVTGKSDGSEGLESKAEMSISGGEVYVYAYDDAINAGTAFNVSGGKIYAYAKNNDGIDSNGSMLISGGLIVASGTSSPEGGIDVDHSNQFKMNGGVVLSLGGTLMSTPSTNSAQRCVIYNGITLAKGKMLTVLDASSKSILTFEFPRTVTNASFFFSCPDLTANGNYKMFTEGTLSGYTDSWNGWYKGGTWSGGSQLSTLTTSSPITTIGTSNNMSGGNGGAPGGGPGGW